MREEEVMSIAQAMWAAGKSLESIAARINRASGFFVRRAAMKTEVRFKGTLADFYPMARDALGPGYFRSAKEQDRLSVVYTWSKGKAELDDMISFVLPFHENPGCWLEGTRIPNGCLITAEVDDKDEECLAVWTKLHSEMERRGWVDTANNALSSVTDPTDAKTEIISKNQSGGITAQNVYVQGGQMVTATQAVTQGRRTKKVTATILILVGVLISIATDAASNSMPLEWKPYLWISWPILGVLVLISIVLLRWQ